MILSILSRPWWKTLAKGEDGGAGGGASNAGPVAPREEKPAEPELKATSAEEVAEDTGDSAEEIEEEEANEEAAPARAEDLEALAEEDPFSEAYDLEHGRPIRDRLDDRGGELPWRSRVDSAKEFFSSELLYRFDILEKERRELLRGIYRLELKGYRGGVWTIVLGDEMTVVNRREEADIVFIMQQKDFLHLVNGEINPQLAILAQKVCVTGDMRKAIAFEELICPTVEG